MTEVLAGAVGGALALLGGFLIQWQAGRRADRERLHRLAARVDAERAGLMWAIFEGSPADFRVAFQALVEATTELMLGGSDRLIPHVEKVQDSMRTYLGEAEQGPYEPRKGGGGCDRNQRVGVHGAARDAAAMAAANR